MPLTKYKITDKEAAAKEYLFVNGDTKPITEETLTDKDGEVLFNNGYAFIELVKEPKGTKDVAPATKPA